MLTVALGVSGCIAEPDEGTEPPDGQASDDGAPLDGLLESEHPGPPGSSSPARWSIYTDGDQVVAIDPTGGEFPIGSLVESTAERVEFGPDPNCETAPGGEGGTYTLSEEDGAVSFAAVGQDSCPARQEVLTAETWRRGVLPRTTRDVPEPVLAQTVADVALGAPPQHLATFAESVWVTTQYDATLHRIDPKTNAVAGIELGTADEFKWLAVGEGSVWVPSVQLDQVHRVDPATNTVVATIPVGTDPTGMLPFDGSLWVSNHRGGDVTRIDVTTNEVTDTIKVGPAGPAGPQTLVPYDDGVVVVVPSTSELVRIDPATGETSVEYTGRLFGEIAVSGSQLWAVEGGSTSWVTRIDDGEIDLRLFIGQDRWTRALATTGDDLWACTVAPDWIEDKTVEVVQIDPTSDTVIARHEVPSASGQSCRLAVSDDGDIWVAHETGVTRIRPST